MQKILTPKATKRLERNKLIIKEYKKLFVPGSHKTAVCDKVAENMSLSRHKVYKVINNHLKPLVIPILTIIASGLTLLTVFDLIVFW